MKSNGKRDTVPPETYTFSVVRRAKWWKIPWCIVRRKPWRWIDRYSGCTITNMRITSHEDQVTVQMELDHPVLEIGVAMDVMKGAKTHEGNQN
jgi:hypothetical protein